jgi:hypothetical protein
MNQNTLKAIFYTYILFFLALVLGIYAVVHRDNTQRAMIEVKQREIETDERLLEVIIEQNGILREGLRQ